MIQALFYKEWIKSRWALLVILLSFAGVIIYSFVNISQGLRVSGINQIWDMIVQKGVYYFGYVKFLPLLAGLILAIVQYIPEMTNKRLKLTLHLPLPDGKIMLTMLGYGLSSLLAIFILAYIVIYFGTSCYFPSEIALWNATVTIPWFLGGLTAYLLTAWVCIEPVWRQRILNTLVAVLIVALFYFDVAPGAYSPSMIYILIITLLSVAFSFHSLIRFKNGELF